MPSEFEGRHVVVTGGTGFLGSAVAAQVIEAGGRVSIPYVHEKEAQRFALRTHERVKLWPAADLTDESFVERFYREAVAWGNGPWASVHIAGGFAMAPAASISKADFVGMMQMNALTCFLCCREAVKAMKTAGGGRVVNVAARPALEPRAGAGMVPYTASKAAVAAITQALAEEVAADGILVNAVVPSIMDTAANRAAMPNADFSKWPKVEQVAATICFLASPQNTVTRGGLVPVYGGS